MSRKRKKPNYPNRRLRDPRGTRQWPLWIMAARDLALGATQVEAATGIGIVDRTLRQWMTHPAWREAQLEAYELCLQKLDQEAMQAISHNLKRKNGLLGLEWMKLRNPKPTKIEVTGKDGGAIETKTTLQVPAQTSLEEWAGVAEQQQSQLHTNRIAAAENAVSQNGKPHANGNGAGPS